MERALQDFNSLLPGSRIRFKNAVIVCLDLKDNSYRKQIEGNQSRAKRAKFLKLLD